MPSGSRGVRCSWPTPDLHLDRRRRQRHRLQPRPGSAAGAVAGQEPVRGRLPAGCRPAADLGQGSRPEATTRIAAPAGRAVCRPRSLPVSPDRRQPGARGPHARAATPLSAWCTPPTCSRICTRGLARTGHTRVHYRASSACVRRPRTRLIKAGLVDVIGSRRYIAVTMVTRARFSAARGSRVEYQLSIESAATGGAPSRRSRTCGPAAHSIRWRCR